MEWYRELRTKHYDGYVKRHAEYYSCPASGYIAPFRIADGLYYVGDKKVCIHLIETAEGLILLDAGFPSSIHLLTESIRQLGFDPADVRWIILTHCHFDHFGAANEFRRLYGTKVAMSAADTASLRELPSRAHIHAGHSEFVDLPVIDRELEDGEIFSFGGKDIRCVLTPGHTLGVMTFLFDVTENDETYLAGLFGGAGKNALGLPFMLCDELPLDMPQRMLDSIARIENEPVVVHLGNHPGNNKTLQKREQQLKEGGNPFIDPGSWSRQMTELRETTLKMMESNAELQKKYGN